MSNTRNLDDAGVEPEVYIAQERFSRVCPTNGMSYCDVGDPEGMPLVMLCGSSMDCVLTATLAHAYCKEHGVRLIGPDKPGMGATPSCTLEKRVANYADLVDGLLTYLDVKPFAFASISSGFIYGLYIMAHKQHLFGRYKPALLALSPWISFDDAPSLAIASIAPDALVAAVPSIISTFTSPTLTRMFSWSSGISSGVGNAVRSVTGQHAVEIEPGRRSVVSVSQATITAALRSGPRSQGMSDEYLLCLRRGPPGFWGYKDYPEVLTATAKAAGLKKGGVFLKLYMGDEDGLVPRKAQTRFIAFFNKEMSPLSQEEVETFDFHESTFMKGGHNDVATFRMCWDDVVAYCRSVRDSAL